MGNLPVVTWTIGSSADPDISNNEVLEIEENGSLTFVNVPLNYTSDYTVEMTKSGLGKAVTNFTLRVFEVIESVSLSMEPDLAIEGTEQLTLRYSMLQGVVEQRTWFFDGAEIKSSSHYLVKESSLVILGLNRRDTGQYTVLLTNPFSRVAAHINVTVLYGPDEPLLEARDSLSISCRAEGVPPPKIEWIFGGQTLSESHDGVLNLTNIQTSQAGVYTCRLTSEQTKEERQKNMTLNVYGSPVEFLPTVGTTVNSEGKIVVEIHCVSEASPEAVVSWSKGSEALTNETTYQISSDTTQLRISHYNVSNFLLQNYTCSCSNPLGSQRREIQLRGPSISRSSLFPNQDGTIVTLTWEVPPTSVVTGFDIQMKGPDLLSENPKSIQTRGTSNKYRIIQQKPGSARSADISFLDPNLTYRFRIIPKARLTEGEPTEAHRIGPGEGLSGAAIAGIAAGIPCSLLFLLLLGGLIYLCVYWNKNKSQQTRYPVSRAVEAITTQSDPVPHILLTGGLKSPPDYNRLQQTPSERSVTLPTFVPPPPVRVATTV
ncbi:hypothetical protein INR49_001482 [Caranx melampygus]|nr:hypothetical protein INR49_001482 [Caranx melampygus]